MIGNVRAVLGDAGGNTFEVLKPANAIFCSLFSLWDNNASRESTGLNQGVG